jgi:hypothetical protein
MPQRRYTMSPLGASIVRDVKQFIVDNNNGQKNDTESTPEAGAEMLANAICFAITKAFDSPLMQTAFSAGVGPSTPGTLIYTALKPLVTDTGI